MPWNQAEGVIGWDSNFENGPGRGAPHHSLITSADFLDVTFLLGSALEWVQSRSRTRKYVKTKKKIDVAVERQFCAHDLLTCIMQWSFCRNIFLQGYNRVVFLWRKRKDAPLEAPARCDHSNSKHSLDKDWIKFNAGVLVFKFLTIFIWSESHWMYYNLDQIHI